MPLSIANPKELSYRGVFRGVIASNDVEVNGKGTVVLGNDGQPDITVSIPAESPSAIAISKAYEPDGVFLAENRVKWESAIVETDDGIFRVTDHPFLLGRNFTIGATIPQPQTIRLGALRAEFELRSSCTPRYWMLPLYNLMWEARPQQYHELDDHPLWLSHNRGCTPATDTAYTFPPPVIAFRFDGKPAFVQRVKDYDDLRRHFDDGAARRAITAVMVGEISGRSFDFPKNDPPAWFPIHLLSWLSLAVGCTVGAPWIELLDDSGNLVRRVHLKFSQPTFNPGLHRIDDSLNPGAIGYLLTKALASPHFGKALTAIPLLLANECIIRGGSLEYRKVQLVRAFECLSKHFGVAEVDLAASIDPIRKPQLEAILHGASDTLRASAQGLTGGDRTAIERIADRVKGCCGKEKAFGIAVKSLAERFRFSDSDVLDKHYMTNPANGNSTWAGALSLYRGAVIHEGFFAFNAAGGKYSMRDVAAAVDHLEDLLIRILLKLIDYDGPYRSLIRANLAPVAIDWVKPGQTANSLGFGVDRSM